MGKHKKNKNGGGEGYYSAYMAGIAASGEAGGAPDGETPYPDSMRVSTLLEQIGKERSWEDNEVEADISVCDQNRLYFIRDLRILSPESWDMIKLLPIVKDLLRLAIGQGIQSKKDFKKQKKHKEHKEHKHHKEKKTIRADPDLMATDERPNGSQEANKANSDQKSSSLLTIEYSPKSRNAPMDTSNEIQRTQTDDSSSSSSGSSSSSSDTEIEPNIRTSTSLPTTKPVRRIQPMSASRIRVTTSSGETFECDRMCPHKGVDLVNWGSLLGNTLVCTKHSWAFKLENGGVSRNGKGIHACKVNDW